MPDDLRDRSAELQQILSRYEHELRSGSNIILEDWVRAQGIAASSALPELVELEMHRCFELGNAVRARDYFVRFPSLLENHRVVRRLIDLEWRLLNSRSQNISEESFRESYQSYLASRDTAGRLPVDTEIPSSQPATTLSGVSEGQTFGPYRLIEKLGEGGMGAVYRARHLKLGKDMAIKLLSSSAIGRPQAVVRFEREMLAVGRLHHPNLVQAHDAGEIRGVHYIAMEFVEGSNLQEYVRAKGPLPSLTACKIVLQTAQGLAVAHQQGLVHRDIKPANLMLTKQGRVKILDLGLARFTQEEALDHGLTGTGECFGTPDYMAPEQWEDAHRCDERGDLYALGCTLYFLLTGRPPYAAPEYPTAPRKMVGHVRDPIPKLKNLRPDVPADLIEVFEQLLAKSPQDRIGSANAVANVLQQIIDSLVRSANSETARNADLAKASTQSSDALNSGAFPSMLKYTLGFGFMATLLICFLYQLLTPSQTTNPGKDSNEGILSTKPASALLPPEDLPRSFSNGLGMAMIFVEPGSFTMGSPSTERGRYSDEAQRIIRIERGFYLANREVTRKQWTAYAAERQLEWTSRQSNLSGQTDDHPATNVSYDDCVQFCDWLTKREGGKWVYSLPTEAEWEYACRGGNQNSNADSAFSFGNDERILVQYANIDGSVDGYSDIAPVARFKPNAIGLFDMHGNVAEWCADTFDTREKLMVVRGGSWRNTAPRCRSAMRAGRNATDRVDFCGFRVRCVSK